MGGRLPAALEERRRLRSEREELRLGASNHTERHSKGGAGEELVQVDPELVHELVQECGR